MSDDNEVGQPDDPVESEPSLEERRVSGSSKAPEDRWWEIWPMRFKTVNIPVASKGASPDKSDSGFDLEDDGTVSGGRVDLSSDKLSDIEYSEDDKDRAQRSSCSFTDDGDKQETGDSRAATGDSCDDTGYRTSLEQYASISSSCLPADDSTCVTGNDGDGDSTQQEDENALNICRNNQQGLQEMMHRNRDPTRAKKIAKLIDNWKVLEHRLIMSSNRSSSYAYHSEPTSTWWEKLRLLVEGIDEGQKFDSLEGLLEQINELEDIEAELGRSQTDLTYITKRDQLRGRDDQHKFRNLQHTIQTGQKRVQITLEKFRSASTEWKQYNEGIQDVGTSLDVCQAEMKDIDVSEKEQDQQQQLDVRCEALIESLQDRFNRFDEIELKLSGVTEGLNRFSFILNLKCRLKLNKELRDARKKLMVLQCWGREQLDVLAIADSSTGSCLSDDDSLARASTYADHSKPALAGSGSNPSSSYNNRPRPRLDQSRRAHVNTLAEPHYRSSMTRSTNNLAGMSSKQHDDEQTARRWPSSSGSIGASDQIYRHSTSLRNDRNASFKRSQTFSCPNLAETYDWLESTYDQNNSDNATTGSSLEKESALDSLDLIAMKKKSSLKRERMSVGLNRPITARFGKADIVVCAKLMKDCSKDGKECSDTPMEKSVQADISTIVPTQQQQRDDKWNDIRCEDVAVAAFRRPAQIQTVTGDEDHLDRRRSRPDTVSRKSVVDILGNGISAVMCLLNMAIFVWLLSLLAPQYFCGQLNDFPPM